MRLPDTNTLDELLAAALYPSHDDGAFSQTMFHALAEQVRFDSASLNLCVVAESYRLPELKCYFLRQPQAMAINCQKTCHTDTFSPNLLTHNFKALDGGDYIKLLDEWPEHPHYLNHCRYFDVQNAMAIAAHFPGHLRRFLMLYFYLSTPGGKFRKSDISVVDRLFPALFSLWLYRLGFICAETLTGRLQLLQAFETSPKLFRLVRLVVQNPMASSKEYARVLGISERTVEHQLQSVFDKLKIGGYNKNKKIELFRLFQFLEH